MTGGMFNEVLRRRRGERRAILMKANRVDVQGLNRPEQALNHDLFNALGAHPGRVKENATDATLLKTRD